MYYNEGDKKSSYISGKEEKPMKLKKYLALILSAVMACSVMCTSVSAEAAFQTAEIGISPAYETTSDVISSLSISSNTATCKSECQGYDDVIKITAVQTLQKYWGLWIWEDVKDVSWTKTVNGKSISMSNTKSGLSSGTYRLKSEFTLTSSSGKAETVTVYSTEKSI